MMKCHRYKINVNGNEKELAIVGEEDHNYNDFESNWSEKLLEKVRFDFLLVEGEDLNRFIWILFRYLSLPMYLHKWLTVHRNPFKKTLTYFARTKKIPINYLEEGQWYYTLIRYLALISGTLVCVIVAMFFLNLFLLPYNYPRTIPQLTRWRTTFIDPLMVLVLFFCIIDLSILGLGHMKRRNKIMADKIIKNLKNIEFKKALIVIGAKHIEDITTQIEDEFRLGKDNKLDWYSHLEPPKFTR